MKKIFGLIITLLLLVTTNVRAVTNRLYFTEKDDRLYYDTDAFDEDIFIFHEDMVPGKEYTDVLSIENDTKVKYKLYMKVKENEQEELADELLNNILMKIYLDGELVYDGYARGLDYNALGVNLQEAILLGNFKAHTNSELVVKTKLADEYSNINNDAISSIDWEFYAYYDKKVVPVNPATSDNITNYIVMLSVSSLIFIFFIVFIFSKNKRKKA